MGLGQERAVISGASVWSGSRCEGWGPKPGCKFGVPCCLPDTEMTPALLGLSSWSAAGDNPGTQFSRSCFAGSREAVDVGRVQEGPARTCRGQGAEPGSPSQAAFPKTMATRGPPC